jgi:glycerol-3-phosphate dehydrogenase
MGSEGAIVNRSDVLDKIRERSKPWDIIIIGGGATGLGCAVDAASRGYDVLLLEQSDFAKGTSSRSTKLVHGGVRYLQQGNVSLVMEALKERGLLHKNAPHLVHDVPFIVPSYAWWESPFYGIGLKVYDLLAGRYGFNKSSNLSKKGVVEAIPSIEQDGLYGGTRYYDGQFDDARLAVNLVTTIFEQGGVAINYAPVVNLQKDESGEITGVVANDAETGDEFEVNGRVFINATGPFADGVRRMDKPDAPPIIAPSQGIHIVLDRSFLPGDSAIMVPSTDDGRVMFAIPWHDVAVVGTTDGPVKSVDLEPLPRNDEVEFILETANRYLEHDSTEHDIKSVFAGIRPLVKIGESKNTAALSRDHTILIDPDSGLMTIAGGKWTTYRKMAQDAIDQAMVLGDLELRECKTERLPIHGYHPSPERFGRFAFYGSDAPDIEQLINQNAKLGEPVHPKLSLTRAEVRWACRNEMARTVDDILARRSRSLLFDARAAKDAAPLVAELMAAELGHDDTWIAAQVKAFTEIASGYIYQS